VITKLAKRRDHKPTLESPSNQPRVSLSVDAEILAAVRLVAQGKSHKLGSEANVSVHRNALSRGHRVRPCRQF
jgi:hypothetical protein